MLAEPVDYFTLLCVSQRTFCTSPGEEQSQNVIQGGPLHVQGAGFEWPVDGRKEGMRFIQDEIEAPVLQRRFVKAVPRTCPVGNAEAEPSDSTVMGPQTPAKDDLLFLVPV